jgi:uncharacterized membrane protein
MAEADEQEYGISRLLSFSDGVFGFAITLLITTIPFSFEGVPPSASIAQILPYLLGLLPNFYAYVLSFFIIGNYWVIHHRMYRKIIKYDTTLLWINLITLFFITFLPLPTALLGRYGENPLITALYAATQAFLCLIFLIMSWYTASHDQVTDSARDQRSMTYDHLRSVIPGCIFALSIGLAFLNNRLAQLSWIAMFFIRPIIIRFIIRRKYGPPEES